MMEISYTNGLIISGLVMFGAIRLYASNIYDILIVNMTKKWYKAVLDRVPNGSYILDVGIGTGSALLENKDTLNKKNLSIVGVDYDKVYIETAKGKIQQSNLSSSVRVFCKSIYDNDLDTVLGAKSKKFDCAYFSGSWTLMPDPVKALHIASQMVKPDGKIYVTQTFQRQNVPFLGTLKPLLKYLTRIDFGQLHFEADLARFIKNAETPVNKVYLELEENLIVPGSIDNKYQSAKLLVFKKVHMK